MPNRQKNGRFVNLYKVITNQFAAIPTPIKDESIHSSYCTSKWMLRDKQDPPHSSKPISRMEVRTNTLITQEIDPPTVLRTNSMAYGNHLKKTIDLEESEFDAYSVGFEKQKTVTTLNCRRKQLPNTNSNLYNKKLNMTLKSRCKSTSKRVSVNSNYKRLIDNSYENDNERNLPPITFVI